MPSTVLSRPSLSALLALCMLLPAAAFAAPILLEVDARQSSRGLQLARLRIPVQAGPLTLRYPQ